MSVPHLLRSDHHAASRLTWKRKNDHESHFRVSGGLGAKSALVQRWPLLSFISSVSSTLIQSCSLDSLDMMLSGGTWYQEGMKEKASSPSRSYINSSSSQALDHNVANIQLDTTDIFEDRQIVGSFQTSLKTCFF